MATIGTQSLNQLVRINSLVSGLDSFRKTFFDADQGEAYVAKFRPVSPQAEVLRSVGEMALSGGAVLCCGATGTGKTSLLMLIGKLLTVPFPSDSFTELANNLNNVAVVRAFSALRTQGRRWLVVIPEFVENSDFGLVMSQALNGALYKQCDDDYAPESNNFVEEFSETAQYLREHGSFDGLLVLCDAFDQILDTVLAEPEGPAAKQLQAFTQYCSASRFPVMMIANVDRELGQFSLEEETIALKMFGRMQVVTLLGRVGEWEELVSRVVVDHSNDESWQAVTAYKDLRNVIETTARVGLYQGASDRWLTETVVQGAYPMHPAALFALPRVASCLGARQKTSFGFFSDAAPGGFTYFLRNFAVVQPNSRLHLYTADSLFTYFEKTIQSDSINKDYLDALQKAVMVAGDIPQTRRILRMILIFQMVGHDRLRTTADNLIWALHLGERETRIAKHSLELLVQKKALVFSENTGEYLLPVERHKVSLEDSLQRLRNRIRAQVDVCAELQAALPKSRFEISNYNARHNTDRAAFCRVFAVSALRDVTHFMSEVEALCGQIRPYRGDLLIAYVMPESAAELDELLSEARAGKYTHERLVLALPKQARGLSRLILEVKALERLQTTEHPFSDSTSDEYKHVSELIEKAREQWQQSLKQSLDVEATQFCYKAEIFDNLNMAGLDSWLESRILDLVGEPPVLDSRELVRLRDRGHARKQRQVASNYLLSCRGELALRSDSGSVGKVLHAALVKTGILCQASQMGVWTHFRLADDIPSEGIGRAFQFLRSQIVVGGGREVRCEGAALVGPLLKAPYGLTPAMIELLLAAVAWQWHSSFSLYKNFVRARAEGRSDLLEKVPISAETLFDFVGNAADWAVCFSDAQAAQRPFLEKVIAQVGAPESLDQAESMWDRAGLGLLNWYKALPAACKVKDTSGDAHAELVRGLCEDFQSGDKLRELVEVKLPRALGASPMFAWQAEASELSERFVRVIGALGSVVQRRLEFLAVGLKKLLASHEGADAQKSWMQRASIWLQSVSEGGDFSSWGREHSALVEAIESGNDSLAAVRALVTSLGYPELEEWTIDFCGEILDRYAAMREDVEWGRYRYGYTLESVEEAAINELGPVLANSGLDDSRLEALLSGQLKDAAWEAEGGGPDEETSIADAANDDWLLSSEGVGSLVEGNHAGVAALAASEDHSDGLMADESGEPEAEAEPEAAAAAPEAEAEPEVAVAAPEAEAEPEAAVAGPEAEAEPEAAVAEPEAEAELEAAVAEPEPETISIGQVLRAAHAIEESIDSSAAEAIESPVVSTEHKITAELDEPTLLWL